MFTIDSALDTQSVLDEIFADKRRTIASNDIHEEHLNSLISDWSKSVSEYVEEAFPFQAVNEQISAWQRKSLSDLKIADTKEMLNEYAKFCIEARFPFEDEYWKRELITRFESDDLDIEKIERSKSLLLIEWQKKLDQTQSAWELDTIQKLRQQFVNQVKGWIDDIDKISEALLRMGFSPQDWLYFSPEIHAFENGIWLSHSEGQLTNQNVDEFKRWAKYFSEDESIQQICEMLGKLNRSEQSLKAQQLRELITFDTHVIDSNSKEEIVGVTLGKDIEHALPSELALLSDTETSLLFDLKYLESQLLCFEMNGISSLETQHEKEHEVMFPEDENKGPMILCIDTSGSMQGSPEVIAKATTLYLASEARKQNRACYLINFSSTINTLELSGNGNLSSLIDFLGMSFHGGTDVAPALRHAMDTMETEKFEKADVLVISDFIMSQLSPELLKKIEAQQERKNSFNSLVIGDIFMSKRVRGYFDYEWVFDPDSSIFHEIIKFKEQVLGGRTQ
ncbi:VWA domain-containing protein [Methylophaga thiooxydans]|uniref:VWA domain-containing protein n=1 Tax=Methylophaga thiooxydans TaxID=392484 RepID=UPI0023527F08|nr:VWA domain-containing protein [Methylophaga thiooxydans]